MGKRIIDQRGDPIMLKLLKESFDEDLSGVLKKLPEREAIVIKEYFGLGQDRKTLDEIGAELNLSREVVRAIREKALRHIKHRGSELRQYLGEEFPV
jgi:RNA polymerase primary sigma factor